MFNETVNFTNTKLSQKGVVMFDNSICVFKQREQTAAYSHNSLTRHTTHLRGDSNLEMYIVITAA